MATRAEATAAPRPVRLGGVEYKMSPLTDQDIAYLDGWVRKKHVEVARSTLPEDATEEQKDRTERIALAQASAMSFMSGQGVHIIAGIDGWSQIMWCGLHRNHPELTVERIAELLIDPKTLAEAQDAWDVLNNGPRRRTRRAGAKKKKKSKRKAAQTSRRRNR